MVIGASTLESPNQGFFLSAQQFKTVTALLSRGFVSSREIAHVVRCDMDFIEFCSQFAFSAAGCRCIGMFGAARLSGCPEDLRLNCVNDDGDCTETMFYRQGSERLVESLWARYGTQWKTSKIVKRDDPHGYSLVYSQLNTHCAGMKCGCPSWAACRKGDPDKSEPGFFEWLRALRRR